MIVTFLNLSKEILFNKQLAMYIANFKSIYVNCFLPVSTQTITATEYRITGVFGGLADFIYVKKLKLHNLISAHHGLVKVSYTTRKPYQFQLFT